MNDPSPSAPRREPIFNNVPAVVVGLATAILAASVVVLLGSESLQNQAVNAGAIFIGETPPRPLGPAAPFVLHTFLHGGWAHLLMNLAGVIAFGVAAARRLGDDLFGAAAFLILFFAAAAAGGFAEIATPRSEPAILIGASGGVFGLIGAAVYVLGARGHRLPAPFSRRVLTMLAPWVVVNLVIAALGGRFMGAQMAWVAHLGGLAAGWLLFPLLVAILDQKRSSM